MQMFEKVSRIQIVLGSTNIPIYIRFTWFPLHGERAHSLYFCIYIRRFEVWRFRKREGGGDRTDLLI